MTHTNEIYKAKEHGLVMCVLCEFFITSANFLNSAVKNFVGVFYARGLCPFLLLLSFFPGFLCGGPL